MKIKLCFRDQNYDILDEISISQQLLIGTSVYHSIGGSLDIECEINFTVFNTEDDEIVHIAQVEITDEMRETLKKIRHESN